MGEILHLVLRIFHLLQITPPDAKALHPHPHPQSNWLHYNSLVQASNANALAEEIRRREEAIQRAREQEEILKKAKSERKPEFVPVTHLGGSKVHHQPKAPAHTPPTHPFPALKRLSTTPLPLSDPQNKASQQRNGGRRRRHPRYVHAVNSAHLQKHPFAHATS